MSKHHRAAGWANISKKARPKIEASLPQPCGRCGRVIYPGDKFIVGHQHDLAVHGQIEAYQPEHPRCSSKSGGRLGRAMQLNKQPEQTGGFHHDI